MGGKVQEDTKPKLELPALCVSAWNWFIQLNATRTSSEYGLNPICYTEMWHFFNLQDIEPEPFEVELIKEFDQIALSSFAKQQQEQRKAQEAKLKSKRK